MVSVCGIVIFWGVYIYINIILYFISRFFFFGIVILVWSFFVSYLGTWTLREVAQESKGPFLGKFSGCRLAGAALKASW